MLCSTTPLYAQVAVNPTSVSCTASADHNSTSVDGAALIAKYEFRVYLETAPNGPTMGTPLDLGKPTPLTTGCPTGVAAPCLVWTTAQVPGLFNGLAKNTKFVAKVVALGPLGEGVSDPSNPFGFNGPPAKPGVPSVQK